MIVEDETRIAEAHRAYVARVPGFEVHSVVHDGTSALRVVTAAARTAEPVDLVLLDLGLPDANGLDVAAAMSRVRPSPDVIAITSARELDAVRTAVARGVALYLLKPFTFAAFRDKLERYREYRDALTPGPSALAQQDIDRAMAALRTTDERAATPKGVSPQTLDSVVACMRDATEPLTAAEVAARVGLSRVSARRYLEQLTRDGVVEKHPEYGKPGRPLIRYTTR
nr:response regulator [Rhodococcus sp. HNM0569]